VCPTSNALTLHLPDLGFHPHLGTWLGLGYPFCVCTDDTGVFSVTLSSELAAVAEANALPARAVAQLARQAFNYSFMPAAALADIAAAVDAEMEDLLDSPAEVPAGGSL